MSFIKYLTNRTKDNKLDFINLSLAPPDSLPTNNLLDVARFHLGINRSANDYALAAVINFSASYSELRNEIFTENFIPYVTWYKKPNIEVSYGRLAPKHNKFSISRKPTRILESSSITITYASTSKVKISADGDTEEVSASFNNGTLDFDFPEFLSGMSFTVDGLTGWYEGLDIKISIPPAGYPLDTVINNILSSNDCTTLLNKHGLLDTFISIPDKPYKISVMATAIVKEQKSIV